jgi:hypothetical protein
LEAGILQHRVVFSATSVGLITIKKNVSSDQGSRDCNSMSEVDLLVGKTGIKFVGTKRI